MNYQEIDFMAQLGGIKKKYLIITAKIAVAAVCMAMVGSAQDWDKIVEIFSKMNFFYFFCCVAAFVLAQIIIALRWQYLLKIQNIYIPVSKAVKLNFLGLFYNNFLPSSIGGDFLRAWYVSKHTDKKLEAAFSVFFDRAMGLMGMIVLAFGGYFVVVYGEALEVSGNKGQGSDFNVSQYMKMFYVVLAIAVIAIVFLFFTNKGRYFIRRVRQRLVEWTKRLLISLKVYARNPLKIGLAFVFTFIAQVVNIVGIWFLGTHIGVDVGLKYYFAFLPITWVVGAIPISIGGIGIIEGLLVFLFVAAGSDKEAVFALSLCQRGMFWLVALPGIWIHLVGGHLPGDEFFVDSNKTLV